MSCGTFIAESCFRSNCDRTLCDRAIAFSATEPVLSIMESSSELPRKAAEGRYDEINTFESELIEAGTSVVKVAMFVSLDEQKARLTERLQRPDKFWKYNPGDLDERKLWPAYQEAYQVMLERTSTPEAPWFVLPCDKKWYARLAVTELLIEAMTAMNLSWPAADFDLEAERKRVAEL